MIQVIFLLPVIFFLLFCLSVRKNKARLIVGVWFDLLLASSVLAFFLFAVAYGDNAFFFGILAVLSILAILLLIFGIYILLGFLFVNAYFVFRRERHSLANSLTLILGIAMLAFMLITTVITKEQMPLLLQGMWLGFTVVVVLFVFHVFVFLSTLFVCNVFKPHKHQDYIIVLGSGLIDGEVPPLLGSRIDRAIEFAKKQAVYPVLILSGGKGADEPRAEAEAMRDYALSKGVSESHLIMEAEARNTFENFECSKKLMDEREGDHPYECAYATNNYHVLRAGMMANKNGLKSNGIGSKTAWYYFPNAVLREYLGYLSIKKKSVLIATGAIFLLSAGLFIATVLILRNMMAI